MMPIVLPDLPPQGSDKYEDRQRRKVVIWFIRTMRDYFRANPNAREDLLEMIKRVEAAKQLPPENEARRAWSVVGQLTPRMAWGWWKRLPNPLARRGRPKGTSKAEMVEELRRRMTQGEKPTTAARQILKEHGSPDYYLKNKADALVKLAKD